MVDHGGGPWGKELKFQVARARDGMKHRIQKYARSHETENQVTRLHCDSLRGVRSLAPRAIPVTPGAWMHAILIYASVFFVSFFYTTSFVTAPPQTHNLFCYYYFGASFRLDI